MPCHSLFSNRVVFPFQKTLSLKCLFVNEEIVNHTMAEMQNFREWGATLK
jgi:hypothetical protein